jgi:hypothetical protein
MNDQELTTAVRQSLDGVRMSVPEEQITSRSRAIRAARRRRLAAGVTAIATAGAAAIAAAVILPAPAAPAAQDTAYVVSHVSQALDAVPGDSILFMRDTPTGPGAEVTVSWDRGLADRTEVFASGKLVSETGAAGTRAALTMVHMDYRGRTWSRSTTDLGAPSAAAMARAAGHYTCAQADEFGIPVSASRMADKIRTLVSCGTLKADGTASVGGATAIRLTTPTVDGLTSTWYVSPSTYLPISDVVTRRGTLLSTLDFQWLPATAANLAKMALPAAPRGFTDVSMP